MKRITCVSIGLYFLLLAGNETIVSATNVSEEYNYGSIYISQALTHFILPQERKHEIPLVLLPGRNLSSYIFLTTPDERKGWAQIFAEDGYDVYVVNDPDFDFMTGGFTVNPFTVPLTVAPPRDNDAKQSWQSDVWQRWGFGSSMGKPYTDVRFPVDYFEEFAANYPYVATTRRSYSDAVVALLMRIGPAILVAHSAGASSAVSAAIERPDLVTGFVMIEPAGPPNERDFPALAGKSMLGLYGDYIELRQQSGRKAATETAADLFHLNGGRGEVISLPDDLAIYGNTHLMMQDNNSYTIAEIILNWLNQLSPGLPQ